MKKVVGVILLAILVGLGAGCKDKEAQAPLAEINAQAELEARNIELIRTLTAELDKGNLEIFLKLLSPDFKYYFPSNSSTPMSREDELAMAKMMYLAIPDMKHVITDIFAVKDMVVARYFVQGTHQAELEGIAPTGNKVVISAISIFRIKDGLVVEEIEEADMLGFYQQLGMELKPKAAVK
ncbi:MAG: ester cyclase [Candidatus Aminicenantes bacterium]|nr:ester cyclase [Candidatus Aminicenantes bacterium]